MFFRLRELLQGHLDANQEAEVLTILNAITVSGLNNAINTFSLSKLLSEMDDHWLGDKNNQRLLEILTVDRLDDLNLLSKSKLLSVFQKGWTPKGQEEAICRIILSETGFGLNKLKTLIERDRAFEDLHNLIYHDIDDPKIRSTILDHFKRNSQYKGPLKILSDIDDTVYVNWKDEKYRKKTPYPGMIKLLNCLDEGENGENRGDLVFLTARPKEPTKLAVKHASKTLKKLGFNKSIILPGRLHQFFTSSTILDRKWKNFMEFKRLYPERPFIFFGDSGQGDADLAMRMLQKKGIEMALIHRIHPRRSNHWERQRRIHNLYFYDNTIDAAEHLFKKGLIDLKTFTKVCKCTLSDAAALPGKRAIQRLREIEKAFNRIQNLIV